MYCTTSSLCCYKSWLSCQSRLWKLVPLTSFWLMVFLEMKTILLDGKNTWEIKQTLDLYSSLTAQRRYMYACNLLCTCKFSFVCTCTCTSHCMCASIFDGVLRYAWTEQWREVSLVAEKMTILKHLLKGQPFVECVGHLQVHDMYSYKYCLKKKHSPSHVQCTA